MRAQDSAPTRVRRALMALWAAWVVSAAALFMNQFVFHGSGIGPGLPLGLLSLVVQAIVFVFIARRSTVARAASIVFLVLATLPLQMVGRLIVEQAFWSAGYTAAGFALKATGVLLLFTGESKGWFESPP